MRPRTVVLLFCCLVALGAGVRFLLFSTGWVLRDQGDLLRRATSVTIGYSVQQQKKSLTVSNPEELQEILTNLHVTNARKGAHLTWKAASTVDFAMGDGTVIKTAFVRKNQLDRSDWGQLFVDPRFHEKLCEVVSKTEGKPVDVLKEN
jgi:hypothetical protein